MKPGRLGVLCALPGDWPHAQVARLRAVRAAGRVGAFDVLLTLGLGERRQLVQRAAWLAASPWIGDRALAELVAADGFAGEAARPWFEWVGATPETGSRLSAGVVEARWPGAAGPIVLELPPSPEGGQWWIAVLREAIAPLGPVQRTMEVGVVDAEGPRWVSLADRELRAGDVLRASLDLRAFAARAPLAIVQPLPAGVRAARPVPGSHLLAFDIDIDIDVDAPGLAVLAFDRPPTGAVELFLVCDGAGRATLPPPRIVFLLEASTAGALQVPPVSLTVE